MSTLNKDSILKAEDRRRVAVEVPEWGGTVYIQAMTGAERDTLEAQTIVNGKYSHSGLRSKVLVKSMVDESGSRLFTDDEAEALGSKSAKVLNRLFDIANAVNGLSKDDVDELVKNS